MINEAANNQQATDWRAGLQREIAQRLAAGEGLDDILALISGQTASAEPAVMAKMRRAGKGRRVGQIVRRGDSKHLVRVYLGTDANGKRLYHNKTVNGTKKDAEQWLRGALRRRDLGEPIEESHETFGVFFEEWLKGKSQSLRATSVRTYRVVADINILPALKDRKLSAISPEFLQRFFNDLTERGLAGSTLSLVRAILGGCFNKAVKLEMMRRNPLGAVDPPRVERPEFEVITQEQARAILNQARGSEFEALTVFLLSVGCRPNEALGLKWTDVALDAGAITIQRNLSGIQGDKPILTDPKTKSGNRTITLGAEVARYLRDHRRQQNEARLAAGSEWEDNGLVFCSEVGRPIRLSRFRSAFKRWLKAAGLSTKIRVYDCRHAVATWLIASGRSPKVASERLGHSGIAITLDYYSHVMPGQQQEASEALDELLFG